MMVWCAMGLVRRCACLLVGGGVEMTTEERHQQPRATLTQESRTPPPIVQLPSADKRMPSRRTLKKLLKSHAWALTPACVHMSDTSCGERLQQ